MTDEQRIEDEALMKLIEKAETIILEFGGKRVVVGPDIQADIVRIMRAGLIRHPWIDATADERKP